MKKIPVAILGATGMVGQRFVTLLADHKWFEIKHLIASPASAGKSYSKAVEGRWYMGMAIPKTVNDIVVQSLEDTDSIVPHIRVIFSALDLDKEKIKKIELEFARKNVAVVSNNSAHRWTDEVPMIMPEINGDHLKLIDIQRKKYGWENGLIVVKPNCSIQSYVTILTALKEYKPQEVKVVSMQAISGAGKTFQTWPEMVDNVIPYIDREEEKSEKEPMRIWGTIKQGKIISVKKPQISATCVRVPVSNGHMAVVSVKFRKKPSLNQIMNSVKEFNRTSVLGLPLSPKKLIHVFDENNRPQTGLDRDLEHGMAIAVGRIRKSNSSQYDWEFISLSHNTLRGAAGGSVLSAEFLYKKGYL